MLSRLNEPKESVYRIVLLHGSQCFWGQMDVARVLLLIWISGSTDFRRRVLVSDENVRVVAGSDLLLVFYWGWIFGCGVGVEEAESK